MPVKYGVIGCGAIAQRRHIPECLANPDSVLIAIAAAKKNGKYLMIGLNQRLMPPHVRAKEIIQTGRLGKVLSFRTAFKHPGPEGWSVDAAKSWFFRKDQAFMGVTGDLGIHKADLLR